MKYEKKNIIYNCVLFFLKWRLHHLFFPLGSVKTDSLKNQLKSF